MSILPRLAVTACLLFAAPAQARELKSAFQDTLVPYEDKALGFSLKRPGNWSISRGDRAVCFYAQGRKQGEAMFVTRPTPAQRPLAAMLKEAQGVKGAHASMVKLNGLDAVRMDQEAASGGKMYHARTYMLIAKQRVFNVTLRCLRDDYPVESVVFDNVGKSLSFAK